jgi:P-type Cu+ transporter
MTRQGMTQQGVASAAVGPAVEEITLPVRGMTCAACQHHVERALQETPGVVSAQVNLLANQASVRFHPGAGMAQALVAAVEGAGYEASLPAAEDDAGAMPAGMEMAGDLVELRAALALAAAVVAMFAGMPLMGKAPGGAQGGGDPLLGWASRHLMHRMPAWAMAIPAGELRWGLLVLTAVVMAVLSPQTYTRAWSAARHGATNMNTLVAIGTLAAFGYSAWVTVFPGWVSGLGLGLDVYFEAVLFILAFLLVGAALDARARRRTMDAVEAFSKLLPAVARLVAEDGSETEVPLGAVKAGDCVAVRPGERVPVDGEVIAGASSVDESLVTGESVPVVRAVGAKVIGGTINLDGVLTVRATAVGSDSVLAQIARLLATAQSSRAPMQAMADRASAIFVPSVLALAAVTFAGWMTIGLMGGGGAHSFARAFSIAIAVLVIACPCAMGLAVPAALTVGIGRAARLGILVKGGEALERLARTDTVALDKTGTLTLGRPRVTGVVFADAVPESEQARLLGLAAAVEAKSEHPLGRAVVEYVAELKLPGAAGDVSEFRAVPGKGLVARVGGSEVAVGNAALFAGLGVTASRVQATASQVAGTELAVAVDGRWVLSFSAEDGLRPGAAEAVAALRRLGIETEMLTGDNAAAAASIAREAGIAPGAIHAGMLPEGKVAAVKALQDAGRKVAMVGDGINDAAALAQADSGIAIGSGTDLAREAGDVVLGWAGRAEGQAATAKVDLMQIPTTIRLARRTVRTMRENLFWAVAYNAVGIPVAAGVLYPHFHLLLSPVLASAAMALSSTSVLLNSLRLRRFA